MADHLFGDAFDAPQVPVSTDNSDGSHLFGDTFDVAPAKPEKSLSQKWLDETISGRLAKAAGRFLTLPGDVAQGKFNIPPQNPGELTENDVAQQDFANNELLKRTNEGAGFVGTGAIPSVTRAGASAIPFLNGISPETANLAKTAIEKYGYPVRPGQLSENHLVRSMDTLLGKIPGTGYAKSAADQQTAINRGVGSLIGVDADKVTPETMVAAKNKLQDTYGKIYSPDVNAKIDDQFSSKVLDTLDRAKDVLDSPDKLKVLNKAVSNILDKVKGDGTISGTSYQGLRQSKSVLKDLEKSGGVLGGYAGEIKGHLDDLFRRTIPSDKADLLAQTDKQYAIMKQLRGLVDDGGDISAARLMQVAKSGDAGKERMAFGRGGDLGELANIGQRFKSAPSSNTAENHLLLNLLTGGGLVGTGIGTYMHDPLLMAGPAASAGAGWATSRLLGSYMKNPERANKLISSALGEAPHGSNKLLGTGIAPYLPAIEGAAGGSSASN